MIMAIKTENGMENIKLKTVLIYPPLFPLEGLQLGIPILQGFLKNKDYKNIKAVDINSIYCSRYSQLNIKKYFFDIFYRTNAFIYGF